MLNIVQVCNYSISKNNLSFLSYFVDLKMNFKETGKYYKSHQPNLFLSKLQQQKLILLLRKRYENAQKVFFILEKSKIKMFLTKTDIMEARLTIGEEKEGLLCI